jgi:hypothetical protein
MNSLTELRREVLRLKKTHNNSFCFPLPQLAAFYHLPERCVREELANLAKNDLIHISRWDGHQLCEISNWANPEEFINATADGGHIHAGAGARVHS